MAATTLPSSEQEMTALLSTTSQNYYKSGLFTDNILNSNALYNCLKGVGGVKEKVVGGTLEQINVMSGLNSTVKSYRGWEELDDSPQEGLTASFSPWAQYSGAVTLSGIHKFMNMGKARIVDEWEEKTKQTLGTFGEVMNQHLFDIANANLTTGISGNGGRDVVGLPIMVQADPTAAGAFQAVAQGSEAWWRNKYLSSSATTYKALYAEMFKIYQQTKRGVGGAPDLVFADEKSYADYVMYMDEKVRYSYSDVASGGFESVKFLSAKVFSDVYMPDIQNTTNGSDGSLTRGTMYFLNSKFLRLRVGKGVDFKPQGVKVPEKQDGFREYSLWYGNLDTNNRRKHGVLFNITQNKTS